MTYVNLLTVGLALDIVGVVFLANAMTVRRPRRFIQEYFGIERRRPLQTVLDQLDIKAQIFCGFLALLLGFSLQISAVIGGLAEVPDLPAAEVAWEKAQSFSVLAVGIILLTAALRACQRAWSLAVFRRLMGEFFREHSDWDFANHANVTRELGELLRVDAQQDDSIGEYADRVRSALGLEHGSRTAARRDDAFAPMRNVGRS